LYAHLRSNLRSTGEPTGEISYVGAANSCRSLSLATSLANGEQLTDRRIRGARGKVLIQQGEPFEGLVLVRTGSCKSSILAPSGQQQIVAYHLAGDILGSGAISAGLHDVSTTALEDCEVWLFPLDRIMGAAQREPAVYRHLYAFLSSEVERKHKLILMLGTMRAEQRLASFLLDLAGRYAASGYSSTEFVLRMTRVEIALYLGLTVETVSRLFSRLRKEGFIQVQDRSVRLIDADGLRGLVDG
jgi:CRP/FNR family transcriptional regulator, anaerobic regulatory protein